MSSFVFRTVPSIVNESGSVSRIGEIISSLGHKTVLVVSDQGIVNAGLLEKLILGLNSSGIDHATYTDIDPDPKERMVNEAASIAVEKKSDCIIGIGGGSVLDVAKAASVIAYGKCELTEIYGIDQIKSERLPLVLIPTTAGTGSEVTCSSVISSEGGQKNVAIDPTLYADMAILDDEMLATTPKHIISTTGVDAMVHAIEAYTSATKKNPISDMLACEALRLLMGNIEDAYNGSESKSSRSAMLLGAMLAGQAFANSNVSAVHGFAYALAEKFHLPHGLSNALVLIHILRFNISKALSSYSSLAKALFPEMIEKDDKEAVDYFLEKIEKILKSVDLNKNLRDFEIKECDLDHLANLASKQERLIGNNPCFINYEDSVKIFRNAY